MMWKVRGVNVTFVLLFCFLRNGLACLDMPGNAAIQHQP